MKITIISGSTRSDSQSKKVTEYIVEVLNAYMLHFMHGNLQTEPEKPGKLLWRG